jgi:hypothetical protein
MIFLLYHVIPGAKHPEKELIGDCFASCWMVRRSIAEADGWARSYLRKDDWKIIAREDAMRIRRTDYEDDNPNLAYYEQATHDKEVFVIHESPRFPVFWLTFQVAKPNKAGAEAHFFIVNEALNSDGADFFARGFWSRKRIHLAKSTAQKEIKRAGWRVVRQLSQQPCGLRDLPDGLVPYYDEAEDRGASLVFVHAK